MNEIEARKARAVALLSAWLREESPVWALVDEIRDAVEHMVHCNRWQCGDWNHRHHPNQVIAPDNDECDAVVPCADCETHAGTYDGFRSVPPTLELLDELSMRLERREGVVA